MSISDKKLPFSGNAMLLEKIAINFNKFIDGDAKEIPQKQLYNVVCEEESPSIKRNARKTLFKSLGGFEKVAFDVRRIDQELERNPRSNLQNWSRTDAFIDNEDQKNIEIFGKVFVSLGEIKDSFEREPGWHESYARQLYDQVERALRVKLGDMDIYRPQFAYLEQLIYNRYRLSKEQLIRMDKTAIKHKLLERDENLLKRGAFLHATAVQGQSSKKAEMSMKTGDMPTTQESIVNAIFGKSDSVKTGDGPRTRTITITIKDE